MTKELISDIGISTFLEESGFTPVSWDEIKAGRNSRVYKVDGRDSQAILKIYYRHPEDTRDRLSAEFAFLSMLSAVSSIPAPRPLWCDDRLGLGLYEFLPGDCVTEIWSKDIDQAVDFIQTINQFRESKVAKELGAASEACWTVEEHINLVKKRVSRLYDSISKQDERKAKEFVETCLRPALGAVARRIKIEYGQTKRLGCTPYHFRILSPSDFGFHNVLRTKGQLFFVDFEYAGWDDPVKLMCDFACQPEVPANPEQVKRFWQALVEWLGDSDLMMYAESLVTLYRVKWCCILLNEYLQPESERRAHANSSEYGNKEMQLSKAESYFSEHLGGT
jgi:hypothetical protein